MLFSMIYSVKDLSSSSPVLAVNSFMSKLCDNLDLLDM